MKKLLGIFLTLAMLLSMTACKRGGDYVPTGDALEPEEGGSTSATRPTGEEEVQDLTLTYYADESMNPILSTNYTNRALFSLIYQSLFVTNRDYQVEPQLCKTYSVSEDMLQYTFTIENATFSDGTPLVLADVLASLNAAKESDYYGGRFTHISTMEISGDALVITLDTPMEDLPLLLDIPILKANQLDLEQPLGTGPYILNKAESCLERRTDWWCQSDLVVTASAIALIPAESTTQIRDTFQFETLDLVCADPGSDNYADYRCDYELWDCENGIFLYLACNSSNTVLSIPEVRSALTFAIDRDKIVDTYYRGFARSATLPASPQFPYYSQSLAEKYAFDESKFAKAIAKAGMVGQPVEILVNSSDSLRVRVARDIAQMLTDGGLNATVKELPQQQYLDALYFRNFDMYLGQTKLSPNMDLSAFFYTYGALSYGGVDNSTTYALCLDALENHGNFYTLHQNIMDNGYITPILFRSYAVYATRGLLTELTPARDNVFYYSLGKNMTQAQVDPPTQTDTEPTEE